MKSYGKRIKELRSKKGWSQEELSNLAGVNLRTLQRIENNKTQPRGYTLNAICKALEINLDQLSEPEKKTHKSYLSYIHLSTLGFLAFPLGNVILPWVLWLNKKNDHKEVLLEGRKVLRFQIIWTFLLYISLFMYIYNKVILENTAGLFIYLFWVLFIFNILFSIFSAWNVQREISNQDLLFNS